MHAKTQSLTRRLLLCGAIAGPLFLLVVLIQDYTRPGFDPRLHLLSLHSLGDCGWVQIVNFVLAGLLNLLYTVGLWRRLHLGPAGTWVPLLTGAYGLGLVTVGVFTTDCARLKAISLRMLGRRSIGSLCFALGRRLLLGA
jgi:hypothetical membrane protein